MRGATRGVSGSYRSAALALQIIVSTALLPITVDGCSATRAVPLHSFVALAASLAWGCSRRISWLDVILVWTWSAIGHLSIGFVTRSL